MNKLNNITTQYRKFSKGQYIEHTQFNEFLDYFEDQDRLSKTLLRGVGISCGFNHQLKYASSGTSKSLKTVNGIEISQGVGVTTDGDLITLSNIAQVSDALGVSDLKTIDINSKLYSFFKPYDNSKANYAPFYDDDGNQILLWELSETNNRANEYEPISELSTSILDVLYLLIYVECYEKEVRPCRGVDCDNGGIEQVQNVKVLFTNLKGIQNIVAKGDTLYTQPLHASSPELRLKRALVNAELNSINDFKEIYRDIVLDQKLLGEIAIGMSVITSHLKFENNFNVNAITTLLESVIGLNDDSILGFQYAYDFVKDLVETYMEIKALLPKSFTNCTPAINAFPKHVMIGKVIDNRSENYRHKFYNSPILDDKEIEAKVQLLIQRFNQLIDKFKAPLPEINKKVRVINITPSRKSIQLGSKAIPFYYEFDEEFFKRWSFDKTRHRIADRNLTYNDLSPLLAEDIYIQEAITFNLEKNTFYRIEGHQSQPYTIAASDLNSKKEEHQLSFDVMSLSLEELKDNKDLSKAYYKEYVEANPGIEHSSGVAPGGTFVMVYQSEINPEVIADFSLPYLCCGPKLDVNLSLPQDVICANAKPIPFTVSPLNGTVEASVASDLNGGVTFSNGQYYFNPTLVSESLYDTEIAFTVNGKQTNTSITTIQQPNIEIAVISVEDTVVIDDVVSDLFNTVVTFGVTSLDGSSVDDYDYQWDFLDNGNFISKTLTKGVVIYTYSRAVKVMPEKIRVLISGNGCSETIDVDIPDSNNPPTANAGSDRTGAPGNSIMLNGSGSSNSGGTIDAYSWSITTPSPLTIVSPNAASTLVTDLTVGTHILELTVTDDLGLQGTDTVTIVVSRVNTPPIANAGADQIITLPTDSVMLTGTGSSDSEAPIASYFWAKVTSLASTIANANTAEASVTGMEEGIHRFQLTVTDDGGLTDTDDVEITVEPAVEPSKPYYIGLGNCITAPADWIPVWTPKGNVDTIPFYIPAVGDVFYTDSSLTTLYKPASTSHIVGFSEPPNVIQEDKSYNIDSNGAVISIVNCDTSGE